MTMFRLNRSWGLALLLVAYGAWDGLGVTDRSALRGPDRRRRTGKITGPATSAARVDRRGSPALAPS